MKYFFLLFGLVALQFSVNAAEYIKQNGYEITIPDNYTLFKPDKNYEIIAKSDKSYLYLFHSQAGKDEEVATSKMKSIDTSLYNLTGKTLLSVEKLPFFRLKKTNAFTKRYSGDGIYIMTHTEYNDKHYFVLCLSGTNQEEVEADFSQIMSSYKTLAADSISVLSIIIISIISLFITILGYARTWVLIVVCLLICLGLGYLLYDDMSLVLFPAIGAATGIAGSYGIDVDF